MANGPLQPGSEAVAIGAVGRPALGFVLVVERSELGNQLALGWRALAFWLALDRYRFSWFRFSRLQFSRCLIAYGLIGDRLQLHLGAKGVTAEVQPAERLQISQVLTQQPRLQVPAGGQFTQRQLHASGGVSSALEVAVEGGDADRPAWIGRTLAALIELLQRAVGPLDRFRARGVEAHGAVQEDLLLSRHGRLLVALAKTVQIHSSRAFWGFA